MGRVITLLPDTAYTIKISMNDRGGAMLSSELHSDDPDDEKFNAAIDGIESLILAHALAGVDIESEAYTNGLITAIDSIDVNL